MKLLRIELNNYRQYYGKQKIELSIDERKNITVLEGETGAGKTNILNAITWCLYGEELHLTEVSRKLPLVNLTALEEVPKDGSVRVEVKLAFGRKTPEIIVERFLEVRKVNEELTIEKKDFSVHIKTEGGYTAAADPEFIVDTRILDRKIEKFTLFDGEKIREFFEAGGSKLVESAILDLARIEVVDRTLSHLDSVIKELRRKTSETLSEEIKELYKKIEEKDRDVKNLQKMIKEKEYEKVEIDKKIKEIEKFLREYRVEDVKMLQKERESVEREMKSVLEEIKKLGGMNESRIIETIPLIYAKKALETTLNLLTKEVEKGEIPPNIRDTFLKELLNRGKCICGRDLSQGSEARRKIEELLRKTPSHEVSDALLEEKYHISSLLQEVSNFIKASKEYEEKLRDLTEKRGQLEYKRKKISEKLRKINIDEILSKERLYQECRENLEKVMEQLGFLKSKLEHLERKRDEMIAEWKKKIAKEKQAGEQRKKLNFFEESYKILKNVRKKFVEIIRKEVEERTKRFFFILVPKEWTEFFKDVKIDEEYKISVITEKALPASLSAGQSQLLALSFIAALYTTCGIDVPIFIDTPLGRLSSKPRENIAKNLPKYLEKNQLVFLVTDTEYTPKVRSLLRVRVGKEYKLKWSKGKTRVEKYERNFS